MQGAQIERKGERQSDPQSEPVTSFRERAQALARDLPAQRLWIGGRWSEGDGEALAVWNPATGERLTDVAEATAIQVDEAVQAAQATQPLWRNMEGAERERILWRIADLLERDALDLACLESLNNGKTVREALQGDLPPAIDIFRYYAGWTRKIEGETIPVSGPHLCLTLREPAGVVGAIIPWNYPLLMAAWKLAPALAAGNAVVLKPSEYTPLTALRLASILQEAGIPDGLVNIVPGRGATTGHALARHHGVDKLAFTGSVRTARSLLYASADSNLKPLSLELGGKSPNIIFADADLDSACEAAWKAIFANKGEICNAGSRLLVQREIYDDVLARVVARARTMRVGDPLDERTDMGAQISELQLRRIQHYVDAGLKEGARLCCGGERLSDEERRRGNFYAPTVFAEVTSDMAIAQDEIFGPVLAVLPFADEQEAIELANDTLYGLVSAVWTGNTGRALRMARAMRAGSVWINLWNGFDSGAPFGGVKHSGFGRDMGHHALEQYTTTKAVWIHEGR